MNYAEFVASKKKSGGAIAEAMTSNQATALHMAIGVAGEGGELLDAIKRYAIYQKPIDRENVVEELGDLEFFMEGLRQDLGISREETLEANRAKLDKRYVKGYTDAEAAARLDKA
jgi:NTP pyrophosphatase (non-canonical NTP hydrolase)